MSKSSRAKGPDFRVLRPDLEAARRACRAPVIVSAPQAEERDTEDVEIAAENVQDFHDVESCVWVDPELR